MNVESKMLKEFIGRKITQLAIGEYQIQLRFEDSYSIGIDKSVELLVNNEKYNCDAEMPETSAPLLKCLGKKIVKIKIDRSKFLNVELEDNILLSVKRIKDGYESYQVNFPHDFLVY